MNIANNATIAADLWRAQEAAQAAVVLIETLARHDHSLIYDAEDECDMVLRELPTLAKTIRSLALRLDRCAADNSAAYQIS